MAWCAHSRRSAAVGFEPVTRDTACHVRIIGTRCHAKPMAHLSSISGAIIISALEHSDSCVDDVRKKRSLLQIQARWTDSVSYVIATVRSLMSYGDWRTGARRFVRLFEGLCFMSLTERLDAQQTWVYWVRKLEFHVGKRSREAVVSLVMHMQAFRVAYARARAVWWIVYRYWSVPNKQSVRALAVCRYSCWWKIQYWADSARRTGLHPLKVTLSVTTICTTVLRTLPWIDVYKQK